MLLEISIRIYSLIFLSITVHIGIVRISPIPCGGYVMIGEEKLQSCSKKNIMLFYLSGNLMNIILILCACYQGKNLYTMIIVIFNLVTIIINSISFGPSDVGSMLDYIREKHNKENE